VEAKDLGGCVAGDNSPQAAEILVVSSTEEPFDRLRAVTEERPGIGFVTWDWECREPVVLRKNAAAE
jgi:hypothetical protein